MNMQVQEEDKMKRFLRRAREHMSFETTPQNLTQVLADGSKLIGPYVDYFKGKKYEYFDKYVVLAMKEFQGKESILIKGKEKWFRHYNGEFVDKNFIENATEVFEFLKKALREFPKDKPFRRGTNKLKIGDYTYIDKCLGTLESFEGNEEILFKGKKIYTLEYFGGVKS
jgi:hypothetical protein